MGNRAVFWGTVRMAERKKRCAGNGENVVCLQPLSLGFASTTPLTQGSHRGCAVAATSAATRFRFIRSTAEGGLLSEPSPRGEGGFCRVSRKRQKTDEVETSDNYAVSGGTYPAAAQQDGTSVTPKESTSSVMRSRKARRLTPDLRSKSPLKGEGACGRWTESRRHPGSDILPLRRTNAVRPYGVCGKNKTVPCHIKAETA